jgi:two-component system sensor histidine kinase UhpB
LLILLLMKTSLRYITLFFILLHSFAAYTQDNYTDSLKRVLLIQKPDTNRVNSLISLSTACSFSYPDSGLVYAQQALSLAEKLQDDNKIFWSIVAMNGCLLVLGNYALELDYAYKALPLAKKLNSPATLSYSNGIISDCYYNLGEYSTSLQYFRVVIKICEQSFPDQLYAIYGNLSHIFEAMHQYDSALIYAKKSYDLTKQNNGENKWIESNTFTFLGDAYAGKAYYDSALFYYRASIPVSDDIKMELNKVDAYNGMAKVFKEKGKPDSAILYAKKVLAEKITKTYPQGLLKAANLLAAVYELQKNADSSLKYLHIAINIRDSLFNREKTNAFQNVIFKDKEKQREVEATKSKLQREYFMYFLIALLIIAIIITAVIIRNRRIKQLQTIRNSIADDLHDDIGSALSSISIMSELAKSKSSDVSPLLTSIGESTTTIQENMSDIVWTINSKNDRFENVLQRMNQFASDMLDVKNIELDFKTDTSLASSKLTMEQRKNFYLFFKEAINNAAKYADAKKVSVCIAQKDHYVEMNIGDDGKGFDTSKIFSGNGMNTLKKRATELNGDFKITSNINEGTAVQLKFKIT